MPEENDENTQAQIRGKYTYKNKYRNRNCSLECLKKMTKIRELR